MLLTVMQVQPDEQETTKLDRGLLFVCYQSRIARGFLTQISWAFNDYFPVINFTPTKWGTYYVPACLMLV